jgi:hypothetical protein
VGGVSPRTDFLFPSDVLSVYLVLVFILLLGYGGILDLCSLIMSPDWGVWIPTSSSSRAGPQASLIVMLFASYLGYRFGLGVDVHFGVLNEGQARFI